MMNTRVLRWVFFLCNLSAILPITMAAFGLYKEFIQEHMNYLLIPLSIGVIGSFLLPKYESWNNEREMRQMK